MCIMVRTIVIAKLFVLMKLEYVLSKERAGDSNNSSYKRLAMVKALSCTLLKKERKENEVKRHNLAGKDLKG
jgi:hypothetical protein